jgi:hypothetical protein
MQPGKLGSTRQSSGLRRQNTFYAPRGVDEIDAFGISRPTVAELFNVLFFREPRIGNNVEGRLS